MTDAIDAMDAIDAWDMKVGVTYLVKFVDCCVTGQFEITVTEIVYASDDHTNVIGINGTNNVQMRNILGSWDVVPMMEKTNDE